jgi:Kef-type K+ transport system membrane component KefB
MTPKTNSNLVLGLTAFFAVISLLFTAGLTVSYTLNNYVARSRFEALFIAFGVTVFPMMMVVFTLVKGWRRHE